VREGEGPLRSLTVPAEGAYKLAQPARTLPRAGRPPMTPDSPDRLERAPLDGKVVVIVGGTSGLGLSALRACVTAGARVVAVGLAAPGADAIEAELGPAVRVTLADARDPDTARAAIRRALTELGGFHALYHVAGGSGRAFGDGPLHELTDAAWEETLRLNLTSVFRSNRAAVEQFLEQGGPGSVLNVGSVLGSSPSPRFFGTHAYAAAKAAIVGLTTAAAAHYAPRDIRFNVIVPGLTDTGMSRRAVEDPAIHAFVRRKQPLDGGRAGRPADLDAAVVFFLSDQSRFVTGQVLAVDGGWSVSEGGERD
jgi:NAD(P)-dependent dehydrogenase (short-subunit alcohol dehydrogenase family)